MTEPRPIVIVALLILAVVVYVLHSVSEKRWNRWLEKQINNTRKRTAWHNYRRNRS